MMIKIGIVCCLLVSINAVAQDVPFIALPESNIFETDVKKICASQSALKICREQSSVTYCNPVKFDCSDLGNHNTLMQYIALEQRIDLNCIASINSGVAVNNGKQTRYATYKTIKSDICSVGRESTK